ncbi:MAG: ornithine carbamoyltransferase [Acidilobaceae archaeon]|nr:ornithine carbamoyltransferase [Acidilobaceae archaeon]MCX8165700.1 ornithine carbamoyltransferase [Acidilobaceae archaeon]MDW7974125.1 ornithine carbamoyltransferase [Sulfolobales archaeon]
MRLKGRDLVELTDYTPEETRFIVETGLEMKRRFYAGERVIPVLPGRTIALIFEKPSTRTRVSFEVAARQLGAGSLYLGWNDLQLARGETLGDTARTLSRYVDGIVARVKEHWKVVELANYSSVPVINGLSDLSHPVQALGDMMTILEKKGRLSGIRLAFVGDGSDNVLNSLIVAASRLGVHIVVASPRELRPNGELLKNALEVSKETGATIEFTEDPREAVKGADVVYTDVWVSMGQEALREERVRLLTPYQVNSKLMSIAGSKAIFMHCLPAKRGEEVTDEVMDGPQSVVWDQAENRLHIQKAVLALLIP